MLSLGKLRQEDIEFQANLDYIVRLFQTDKPTYKQSLLFLSSWVKSFQNLWAGRDKPMEKGQAFIQ